MGGKLFAVIVIVIALASAVPIMNHTFLGASVTPPEDISTHGARRLTKQLDETMVEAGLSFLAAQLVLGFFVWKFGGRKNGPLKNFPGGAKYLIVAAILLVGAEAIALGALGTKAWGKVYFEPASADALPIQAQAGQFAFYFRYAGPDGKFGGIHPEQNRRGQLELSSGLTRKTIFRPATTSLPRELAIPVNQGNPSDDARQGRRAFVLRARIAHSAGFRSRPRSLASFHRNQDRESTKSSARNSAAWVTTT